MKHRQGCDALGGYSHGVGPCTCGAENARAGSDEALALAAAWKDLFWQVALSIKCLPSSFIDGNEHVLRKARELQALASAPASAPLLTDVQIADIWNATGYQEKNPLEGLWKFARAIERECLAAAPVAEPAAWMREDGEVVSASLKHSMENHQGLPGKRMAAIYTIPLGRARAALSGGSPEPVSGSEER